MQQQIDGQALLEAIQDQRNQAHDREAQLRAYIQQLEEEIQQLKKQSEASE